MRSSSLSPAAEPTAPSPPPHRFLWRSIFEQAAVGMALVAPDGSWLHANPKLCKIVGYSREELRETTFQEITHPDDLQEDLDLVGRLLDGEIETYNLEKRYIDKDGEEVPIYLTVSLVRDAAGDPDHFIAVIEDLRERKAAERDIRELEDALRRKVDELEASNQELESFSYSVSHDLRAPLRALDGFSRILEEEVGPKLTGEQERYLGLLRSNAQRMDRLINGLLAFSRMGKQALNPQPVNVEELVRNQYRLLTADLESPPKLHLGELPSCTADPVLLERVWSNLLANALKFGRDADPPVIEAGCRREDGEDVYFVRDNGAGFDMRYASKLFSMFQRLHRDDEFPGHGVGLALVQRIVHRHGGRVWAEGEPGKGATFSFTLGDC